MILFNYQHRGIGQILSKEMKVVCCFCGKSLSIDKAMVLVVYLSIDSKVGQQLCCHRECLQCRLDPSIPLYLETLD